MSAIARLRRQRQRERRAVYRDYDIVWLSLFVGVPLLAALVAYLLGMQMFRECRVQVSFLVCVYRQVQPVSQVRQAVPKAFYRAFEGER